MGQGQGLPSSSPDAAALSLPFSDYWATVAASRVVVDSGAEIPLPIDRVALIKARMNNQAATMATPASEIHMIHNATV